MTYEPLRQLQQRFFDAMASGDGERMDPWVLGDDRFPAAERTQLYARMYGFRLRAALEATYPQLSAATGATAFAELADAYVRAHRSTAHAIEGFGDGFPEHLASLDVPVSLVDLARLERARTSAFLAPPSAGPLRPDDLDADTFPHARLLLVESLSALTVERAALWFWDEPTRPGGATSERVEVAVWRDGFFVRHRSLEAAEAVALAAARAGRTVAEVCEAFADTDDPPAAAYAALGSWISDGWVSAIDVPTRTEEKTT